MAYQQLTYEERSLIYAYCKAGFSQTEIAKELNRNKSAICRELARNTGAKGYRPKQAHEKAIERKSNSRKAIKFTKIIKHYVKQKIKQEWSPVQISNWLKKFKSKEISHERIYQYINEDKAVGGTLYTYLRQGMKKSRKRYGKSRSKRGQIPNRVSITQRPEYINKRSTYGHWEGDTIIGKNHKGVMITLVERKCGWTEIIKVSSKNAHVVSKAICKAMKKYRKLVKSITFDNGLEFADHETMARELQCKIYFAEPYSSYQRGTNENTNGLIRQYFPKGSDFGLFTKQHVKFAMDRLNNRPRKRLGFYSPYQIFKKLCVALVA